MASVDRIPTVYPGNQHQRAIIREAERHGVPAWTTEHPAVKEAKFQAYEDWKNTPNHPRKVPEHELKYHLDQVGLFAMARVKTGMWTGQ